MDTFSIRRFNMIGLTERSDGCHSDWESTTDGLIVCEGTQTGGSFFGWSETGGARCKPFLGMPTPGGVAAT